MTEAQKQYQREYRKDPEHREKKRECDRMYKRRARREGIVNSTEEYRIWREKHPVAYKAHQLFNYEIRKGSIEKRPCQICGDEYAYAHHEDYTKPLEVVWLCPAHHQQYHLGLLDLVVSSK